MKLKDLQQDKKYYHTITGDVRTGEEWLDLFKEAKIGSELDLNEDCRIIKEYIERVEKVESTHQNTVNIASEVNYALRQREEIKAKKRSLFWEGIWGTFGLILLFAFFMKGSSLPGLWVVGCMVCVFMQPYYKAKKFRKWLKQKGYEEE